MWHSSCSNTVTNGRRCGMAIMWGAMADLARVGIAAAIGTAVARQPSQLDAVSPQLAGEEVAVQLPFLTRRIIPAHSTPLVWKS